MSEEKDLHLHMLWLIDGAGHAGAIATRLDEIEKELIKESKLYENIFTNLYLKSIEFKGYTRTGLCINNNNPVGILRIKEILSEICIHF